MDLEVIRKQIDKLDQCLDYLVMLRTPLAILVGEVKHEQNLPIYQPNREKKIYDTQTSFAEKTGVNPELLVQIYKLLIAEAVRIEQNQGEYDFDIDEQYVKMIEESLRVSDQILDDFIKQMDSIRMTLNNEGIRGNDFFITMSKYYKGI